jgi:osmotically-inducible protein OsmY
MRFVTPLLAAAVISTQLTACIPLIAGGAAATGVMVADRRTSGIYIEDQAIELKARQQIAAQLGDSIHASVTSFNRNVLLTGEAFDEKSKTTAEAIVKNINNVRNVLSEVIVAPKTSLTGRGNDSYITSKVKARIVAENVFPPNYVKVVTERSVVYLMGLVTKQEAELAVDIASSTEGVEKVVKVFEYIEE